MKTVNDLFILEGMKDSTVLAGHRGLSRPVTFSNISDTPDVINFLDSNHLLLTTGYAFKDNTEALYQLIEEMHALNCSGIIIRIDRFLIELPEEIRLLADRLSFPIINLPSKYTLGEVSHHILTFLNDHKAEQLYYALHVHKQFSEMMIKGYSLPSLVEQLGYFLERFVLLLNHRGEKLASSQHLHKSSMKRAEKEMMEAAKNNIAAARQGLTFKIPSLKQGITTYPVQTKRKQLSILLIADALTLPYPASNLAIEQACNVISFTLIKEQAIDENSRLFKNTFFTDFIERRINSEQEIFSRCDYYGLQPDMKSICIAGNIDSDQNYETLKVYEKKFGELHNIFYDQLEDVMLNRQMTGTLFTKEKYFIMILQFFNYTETEMAYVKKLLEDVQTNIQDGHSVSFGVSNQIRSLIDIPTAYREAVESLMNGYDLKMSGFIKFYKTREIKELISMIPVKNLSELYENTLKSLAYPKTKEDKELVKTIQIYLDCQCEIAETSRRMYIHRNTVKYRIEKTELMLNCNFQDPSDSLRIRVALLIGSLFDEKEEITIFS